MRARFWKLISDLGETFWILPASLVVFGAILGEALVEIDRSGIVPTSLVTSRWLYDGDSTGARTLLGAIASSTIGVAGTVFSITIAALSLAASQMGPRLLRSFTRDRGNQVTLGVFLGTFSYTLMVLRSVRGKDAGNFVPNLSLSVAMLLAFLSVAMLVYFVGHMAGRINVNTVIGIVDGEVHDRLIQLTAEKPQPEPPPSEFWRHAKVITDERSGYLQQLDESGLADWAAEHETAIRMLMRPGDYIFPGAPIALLLAPAEGTEEAIRNATALGPQRAASSDLEFAIQQLVDIAVRALSPGINDPMTAISVLDRLGAVLCELAPRHMPSGVTLRDDRPALVGANISYDGLTDAMFHMIRQNATTSPSVLMRMLEVLIAAARCERRPDRLATLRRHANLILDDIGRNIDNASDLADLRQRHVIFMTVLRDGPAGALTPQPALRDQEAVFTP